MNYKTLCVVPFFNIRADFENLIFKLSKKDIEKHLLVLVHISQTSELDYIKKKLKGLDHSLLVINYIDTSFRVKVGLELAREWSYDYLAVFQEGFDDGIDNFLSFLGSLDLLKYSLVTNSRIPKQFNLGSFFNSFVKTFCSLLFGKDIRDLSGDSAFAIRVNEFSNKFLNLNYLPDNNFIFFYLFLFSHFKRLKIKFLSPSILKRKSFFKYNLNFFVFMPIKAIKHRLLPSSITKVRSEVLSFIPTDFLVHDKDNEKSSELLTKTGKPNLDKFKDIELPEALELKEDAITLEHKYAEHKKQLVVNWCLTNICNYKCSYCPDELHNGTRRGVDLETAKMFVDNIMLAHPDKEIHFELTGGEVTYYKGFSQLIEYIKSFNHYVAIITNGARKIDFWEKNLEHLDHIMLSFHSEQGDPKHFQKVVEFLCDKTSVHVNIMLKPENFKLCHKLAQDLINYSDISIALQPLLEGMDGKIFDYTDEQLKIIENQRLEWPNQVKTRALKNYHPRGDMYLVFKEKKRLFTHSPELISNHFNNWRDWYCNIGIETICVDFYGNLKRGWCNVGGNFGNISDKIINFPKKPILCNKSQCSCGQDIMTTKVRKDEYLLNSSII